MKLKKYFLNVNLTTETCYFTVITWLLEENYLTLQYSWGEKKPQEVGFSAGKNT